MYRCIRPLLFCFSADKAHALTLGFLKHWPTWFCRWLQSRQPANPVEVFGLSFANPVGLAAGFDKNGEAIDALLALGFGFIEVGAVTPKAQPGNPKPHVRRFVESENIVNACGFNNNGVDYLVANLKKRQLPGVVGVNLGRNKSTANENALDDYRYGLEQVYRYADFVTINISSPNTAGLRDLHQAAQLLPLLQPMVETRNRLASDTRRCVPLLVKLSPDLSDEDIASAVQCCLQAGIDGLIATNTSLNHRLLPGLADQNLPGGLSGPAIADLSRHVLTQILEHAQGKLPVISVGGIDSVQEGVARLQSGASLVQLYTGLVYHGTGLVKSLVKALVRAPR